jgi:outer membrane receptor for ferrienterochelin and colicin
LSVYTSQDDGLDERGQDGNPTPDSYFIWEDRIEVNWKNVTSALRWNHVYNNKLFGNSILWSSDYQFKLKQKYLYTEQFDNGGQLNHKLFSDYVSGIRDYALSQQFNWYPNSDHNIRFGGTAIYHEYKPGVFAGAYGHTSAAPEDIDSLTIDAREYSVYIEDDAEVSDRVRINMGMHMSLFNVRKTDYYSFQPRASIRYLLSERWALKGSYSKMTQYLHLLTTAGTGFPIDLWVPPTENFGPQESWQTAVGTNFYFGKCWEVSLEGYYRELDGLLGFENQVSFTEADETWEDKVSVGYGKSRGVEFFLKKSAGRTTGWLSYTKSQTTRSFPDVDNGSSFPFKYDRTDDLSMNIVHRFNTRILVNATWTYTTGAPVTQPVRYFTVGEQQSFIPTAFIYDTRNNARLADYHRLDVGVSFVKQKAKIERTLNVSIYNVYNQKNEFYSYIAQKPDGEIGFETLNLFPIMPSVRFGIKF